MKRTPEPELMDEADQARVYAEADFSEANSLFLECFRNLHPSPLEQARILDLGCGPADITLRLAYSYTSCQVDGLDGADAMLEHGRSALLDNPDLAGRVRLIHDRLPSDRLAGRDYDVVVSNSLLHHLPEPGVLWDTVKQCAKPNAAVLVMDLMRPKTETAVDALVETYAMDAPDVLRRDFRNSLHAAFSLEEVEIQLLDAGLEKLEVDIVSDRHLTVAGFL